MQIKNALFGNLAHFCLGTWRVFVWEVGVFSFGKLARHPKKIKFLLQKWQDLDQKKYLLHLSINLYSHFAICPTTQDGMTKRYGEVLVFP